ncbi:MAG: ATP-dependent DNA ligase [Anaerolineaceae bacterium]|nr:ATP-dependent DNA ligase [Anaerolineaceae bacterium]
MEIDGHDVQLIHLDKVFFPQAGLTKGDLVTYYQTIAPVMVPLIKDHPISVQRFPDGLNGEGFFNKDAPDYFPMWIRRVSFPKREGGHFDAPVIDSEAALIYLANQAVITPHLYLARLDELERPDRMIFDLDPPDETRDFTGVRKAALDIQEVMTKLDLKCWVQTTGSQGFHVVIPLDRTLVFNDVRDFAQDVSRLLIMQNEGLYTLEDHISRRKGRIFLDTLRNSYGATAVAPYAVRARPEASVATPVDWSEVEAGVNPRDWTIKNLPQRMAQRDDPWKDLSDYPQNLQSRWEKLRDLLHAN